jgi:hypothetical protein
MTVVRLAEKRPTKTFCAMKPTLHSPAKRHCRRKNLTRNQPITDMGRVIGPEPSKEPTTAGDDASGKRTLRTWN